MEINAQVPEDTEGDATTSDTRSGSATNGGTEAAQGMSRRWRMSPAAQTADTPAPQTADEPTSFLPSSKGVTS